MKDIKSLAKLYTIVDINNPFDHVRTQSSKREKDPSRQPPVSAKQTARVSRGNFFRVGSQLTVKLQNNKESQEQLNSTHHDTHQTASQLLSHMRC